MVGWASVSAIHLLYTSCAASALRPTKNLSLDGERVSHVYILMRRRLFTHFVMLVLLSVPSLSVMGQEFSDSVLHEAVAVGMKRDATLRTSVPVFRLDSTALRRTGSTDITSALRHLAGVNLRDYGGAGGLKTVSVRGIGATHTAVTYDGMPMADTQGGTIDVSRFAFDLMQSIRLDIADATPLLVPVRSLAAATLDIGSTAAGTDRNISTFQLRTGSWELLNPSFAIRRKVNEKHTLGGAASYSFSNNNYSFRLRNGNTSSTERRHNSRYKSSVGELNWLYRPDSLRQVRTKVYFSDTDSRLPGPVVLYNNSNKEHMGEQLLFAQSRFDYKNNNLEAFAAVKGQRQKHHYTNPDPQYPEGALTRNYRQTEAYATGGVSYKLLPSLAVAYAADYYYNHLATNLTSADDAERHTLLQTASLRYQRSKLSITARLTAHNAWNKAPKQADSPKNLNEISPSVSLSAYPFGQNLMLRAFYKDYYRQPTFSETYFYHLGTPMLKPERTRQVGVGATWQGRLGKEGPALRFTIDDYYNDLTDKISSVPYNLFVWRTENRGKVIIQGLDATLQVNHRLTSHHSLLLSANYSLQDAADRTSPTDNSYGKQSAYLPRHSGAVNLVWENPRLNLGLTFSGASSRWATSNHAPSTRLPGYGELGATCYRDFNLPMGVLKTSLSVHNIFNKNYEIVRRYPMPTRRFVVAVAYML